MFDNDLFEYLEKEVDETKTRQNVKRLLRSYKKIQAMAHNGGEDAAISRISHTGHIRGSQQNSDIIGQAVAKREKAKAIYDDIEQAFNRVDEDYLKCMKLYYFKPSTTTNINIYLDESISESTYYNYVKRAELEFADYYRAGALKVFK
ncbi:hypothetical protein GCM10008929_17380 [Alkalibacterium psychrotolerans]